MTTPTRLTVTESSDSLWRMTFDNPPLNLTDSALISQLQTTNGVSEYSRGCDQDGHACR